MPLTKKSRAMAAKMRAQQADYAPPGDKPKGKGDMPTQPKARWKKQG